MTFNTKLLLISNKTVQSLNTHYPTELLILKILRSLRLKPTVEISILSATCIAVAKGRVFSHKLDTLFFMEEELWSAYVVPTLITWQGITSKNQQHPLKLNSNRSSGAIMEHKILKTTNISTGQMKTIKRLKVYQFVFKTYRTT